MYKRKDWAVGVMREVKWLQKSKKKKGTHTTLLTQELKGLTAYCTGRETAGCDNAILSMIEENKNDSITAVACCTKWPPGRHEYTDWGFHSHAITYGMAEELLLTARTHSKS